MSEIVRGMIAMTLTMQSEMEANREEWKDRLRDEWEESKKFPRKKKKKVRKRILLEYSIASYDPFDGTYKL